MYNCDDQLCLCILLSVHYSCGYFVLVTVNFLNCKFHLLTGDEINPLFSLTKLFPGLRKLKSTGSDFVDNGEEVSHYIAPMHVSTFILLLKRSQ